MTVVVDASLALKWVHTEAYTQEALALRDNWQRAAERAVAPPIFRAEITNVLHRLARAGRLSRPDAIDAMELLVAFVAIEEPVGLYRRALDLAGTLNLDAAYDAQYLALAESFGCDMWTADRKLVRAVERRFPKARWLGELP